MTDKINIHKATLYDFSSNSGMEKDLMPGEWCFARIPNVSPKGFTHVVALVFKDKYGDIFSIPAQQHHGEMQDTKENRDAIQEQSTNGVPLRERAGSGPEIREGEQKSGNINGEPSRQKATNSRVKKQSPDTQGKIP